MTAATETNKTTDGPHQNQPLATAGTVPEDAEIADAGFEREHTLLLGFSQGGCLTAEFVARNTQRYGGVAILSGE